MAEQTREPLLSRFRRQVEDGRLEDNVSIIYRVHGGTPGEDLDESVVVAADGRARVIVKDALGRKRGGDTLDDLGRSSVLELAKTVAAGIDDLVTESEARFVPDALVGSVSIAIGSETETFYFQADEEIVAHQGLSMPEGIRSIVGSFDRVEATSLQ